MKLRARHIHALEALVDNVVGMFINFGISYSFLNFVLGIPFSFSQNLGLTAVVFVVAYFRKYFIRRYTSGIIQRMYDRRAHESEAA